jgi:hypothetical protein
MATRKTRGRETGSAFSRIQDQAVRRLPAGRVQSTNLFIQRETLKRGQTVLSHRRAIPVPSDSVMVFVDDHPTANWAHPCRFQFYEPKTAELKSEVQAVFPPYLSERPPKSYQAFHEPVPLDRVGRLWPVKPRFMCPIRWRWGARYAILFSGDSNNRHVNDLEFLYRTLVDIYGFDPAKISVLNFDGTLNYSGAPQPPAAWPGDGSTYRMPVGYSGTKANFEAVFDDLKTKLKAEDTLLIHTNNHGGNAGAGMSFLCCQGASDYYAADFGAKLGQLPKIHTLMVMMEQCHSGGFNAPIINNSPATYTTVASACTEFTNSWAAPPNWEFDSFARDWVAAMAGHDPYGNALASNPDVSGNGQVSAHEACDYAVSIQNPSDSPVYSQNVAAAGTTHLGQRYIWWWWYCPLLIELLEPYYVKWPIPEFYQKLHRKVLPALEPLEQKLEKQALVSRAEVRQQVRAILEKTVS